MAEGHVRPLDVWHEWSAEAGWWWAHLGPYIEGSRKNDQQPEYNMNFESLVREMQRLDLQVTGKPYLNPATVAEKIDLLTVQLQREQDAAKGIIPSRKVAPVPTVATE
jgi:hypothetical protein